MSMFSAFSRPVKGWEALATQAAGMGVGAGIGAWAGGRDHRFRGALKGAAVGGLVGAGVNTARIYGPGFREGYRRATYGLRQNGGIKGDAVASFRQRLSGGFVRAADTPHVAPGRLRDSLVRGGAAWGSSIESDLSWGDRARNAMGNLKGNNLPNPEELEDVIGRRMSAISKRAGRR